MSGERYQKVKWQRGYVFLHQPDHPNADHRRGYVAEHVAVVVRALGKPLRRSVKVHHVNENRGDNRPSNLVACDSQAYHVLLHARMRAYRATGDPRTQPCCMCGQYIRPGEIGTYVTRRLGRRRALFTHARCEAERYQRYRRRRAAA